MPDEQRLVVHEEDVAVLDLEPADVVVGARQDLGAPAREGLVELPTVLPDPAALVRAVADDHTRPRLIVGHSHLCRRNTKGVLVRPAFRPHPVPVVDRVGARTRRPRPARVVVAPRMTSEGVERVHRVDGHLGVLSQQRRQEVRPGHLVGLGVGLRAEPEDTNDGRGQQPSDERVPRRRAHDGRAGEGRRLEPAEETPLGAEQTVEGAKALHVRVDVDPAEPVEHVQAQDVALDGHSQPVVRKDLGDARVGHGQVFGTAEPPEEEAPVRVPPHPFLAVESELGPKRVGPWPDMVEDLRDHRTPDRPPAHALMAGAQPFTHFSHNAVVEQK